MEFYASKCTDDVRRILSSAFSPFIVSFDKKRPISTISILIFRSRREARPWADQTTITEWDSLDMRHAAEHLLHEFIKTAKISDIHTPRPLLQPEIGKRHDETTLEWLSFTYSFP